MANDGSTRGNNDGLARDATFDLLAGVATAVLTDGTEAVFVADTYNGKNHDRFSRNERSQHTLLL